MVLGVLGDYRGKGRPVVTVVSTEVVTLYQVSHGGV